MRLISRPLPGMLVLQTEPRTDERGFFARCFCRARAARLRRRTRASSRRTCRSPSGRARLRGLHYQLGAERGDQGVTCLQGAVHDVVLDLRPNSPTYGRHAAVELPAAQPAHGRGARRAARTAS